MKNNRNQCLVFLCAISFLFGACKSISLDISKRKYRHGYHVDFSGGKETNNSRMHTKSYVVAQKREARTGAPADSLVTQEKNADMWSSHPNDKDTGLVSNPARYQSQPAFFRSLEKSDSGTSVGPAERSGHTTSTKHQQPESSPARKNNTGLIVGISVIVALVLTYVAVRATAKEVENQSNECCASSMAYNDNEAPELRALREFRDNHLAMHFLGRQFIITYYAASPLAVRIMPKSEPAKKIIRNYILNPLVSRICLAYNIDIKALRDSDVYTKSLPTT